VNGGGGGEASGVLASVTGGRLAARYGHEYAFRVHRQLVELDADGDHTRKLLAESAAITLQEMPALTRDWLAVQREWSEQELLDPPKAELTARALEVGFTELGPALQALLARQDELVAELVGLLKAARRA
jgi:hypothetical protein